MDREKADRIYETLNRLMDHLREDGLEVVMGKYRYNREKSGFAIFTLTVAEPGEEGVLMTREAEDFKRLAPWFGMKREWLGKTFRHKGLSFKITGLNTRARLRPVVTSGSDGKTWNFPAKSIINHMAGVK